MATLQINADNFQSTITDNATVIVDFWAPWCAPLPRLCAHLRGRRRKKPRYRLRQGEHRRAAGNRRRLQHSLDSHADDFPRPDRHLFRSWCARTGSVRPAHRAGDDTGYGSSAQGNRRAVGAKRNITPMMRGVRQGFSTRHCLPP